MCGAKEFSFLAVLVWNRVSISTILVWNRVWFVHSSLELGVFFRRSYFFIIWRSDHSLLMFTPTVYVPQQLVTRSGHRAPGLQVWNTVGYQIFYQVWNRVRVSGSVPHTPPNFSGSTPSPGGSFVVFYIQMGSHCARRSLRSPWKLGLRIIAWSKPRMFKEESLGKIKFRSAFPKRVGPRILSLEIVYYFGTGEHYWVVEKRES